MVLRLPSWTATLTWKAALFITVMCCGLTALLGTLVHISVTRQVVGQAEERALARLTDVTRAYESGSRPGRGAAVDPTDLPGPLKALAASGKRGTMVSTVGSRPVMWAAGPVDGGRALAVPIDYSSSARTIQGFDDAILYSSVLAIGATLLAGAFAVTRVTRRLHTTATVARRISAGDLDARVDDPRGRDAGRHQDEVSSVAGALDTMASSLQGRLLSEQRFTADVAHELRTPLTGLNTAAELLPPGRPTELVRNRVADLRTLTEDLLEISRLDARTETPDLASRQLGPLADRLVRASGLETRVDVVRDITLATDRRRLERVLGNLIANAHKHGRAPVVLTVDGPVITVRDHGAGYPAYLVEHGPRRFRTEGVNLGHGLGLTIAVGQARVLGARLTFTNAADGGAVATLVLPHDDSPRPPVAGTAALSR
ncbi:HAMP domain-containing sensor histidine kinase [Streptomyces sp. NPDC002506]|uniref:HAMP domain-containing sensor histidine kinase n=1 Tax=Streptomyces sp. NPDC002506 TaxID=3154536 RepID=UPI0033343030